MTLRFFQCLLQNIDYMYIVYISHNTSVGGSAKPRKTKQCKTEEVRVESGLNISKEQHNLPLVTQRCSGLPSRWGKKQKQGSSLHVWEAFKVHVVSAIVDVNLGLFPL